MKKSGNTNEVIFKLRDGSMVHVRYNNSLTSDNFMIPAWMHAEYGVTHLLTVDHGKGESECVKILTVDKILGQREDYRINYEQKKTGAKTKILVDKMDAYCDRSEDDRLKSVTEIEEIVRMVTKRRGLYNRNGTIGLIQKLKDAGVKKQGGYYQIPDGGVSGSGTGGGEDDSADTASTPEQGGDSPAKAEGGRRLETHYRIERDPKLRERKIADARENNPQGELVCEACGVTESELGNRYPTGIDMGRIYEVHHIKPLSERDGHAKTELSEVVLLCANCHRIVHIDENVENNYKALKQHFDKQRGKK